MLNFMIIVVFAKHIFGSNFRYFKYSILQMLVCSKDIYCLMVCCSAIKILRLKMIVKTDFLTGSNGFAV